MLKNPPAKARDMVDTGLIPGSGRSPGGGHGNPLQYSWGLALVALMVKNLPAMQKSWVHFLDQEDPLEKKMALQYSRLNNPIDRGSWQSTIHRVTDSWTRLNNWARTHKVDEYEVWKVDLAVSWKLRKFCYRRSQMGLMVLSSHEEEVKLTLLHCWSE